MYRWRTDNTMAKWRTDNTMAKWRTDNTMAKWRTDNTMAKWRTDDTMAKWRTDNTMAKWIKDQKDKQRSTKHTHKTKDRVTRTPLTTGRISSSCSTSGSRRVHLVTNPVINHEWGKDREVFTTSGTYPWSFVTQIFHSGQPWKTSLCFYNCVVSVF
jgi:hypothetical protein